MTKPGDRERMGGSAWRRKGVLALCLAATISAGILILRAQEQQDPDHTKFTMARIRFESPAFAYWGPVGASNGPPWSHDTPAAEQHLMKIMAEVTKLDVNPDPYVTSFDEEALFRYPIAYLCEVGYIDLTEKQARTMAEYLLRGGFLIVDDFRGERELENFKVQLRKVFPDRTLQEIPRNHPIFTCFYDISSLFPPPPYSQYLVPQYLGINDDKGRLMMIAGHNNDLSDYWEWSNDPFMPIEETNQAYKYGVNYLVYALTH